MAAVSEPPRRFSPFLPLIWIAANTVAGATAGLFFGGAYPVIPATTHGPIDGGILYAVSLFGPWAATGLAFFGGQWLVLRKPIRLSGSWLVIAPLAGLGFMAAQFLISCYASLLLGSGSMILAAVCAGWIVAALQWMLMQDPGFSANRWVAASAAGTAAAALIWYPGFPWALSHVDVILAGAVAGCLYGLPIALAVFASVRPVVAKTSAHVA